MQVRANPRCLLTELGDGTGVLLDLDTKFYFTLNATGVVLWRALGDAPTGLATLAETLAAQFEVDRERVAGDVRRLVDELLVEGLVKPS